MVRSGSRTEKCIVDSGLDELKQTMTAQEKSFGRGCGHSVDDLGESWTASERLAQRRLRMRYTVCLSI